MVSKRWKHANTCVYNLAYHLIWCPKFRRPVLVDEIKTELKKLLNQRAKQLDAEIEVLNIMPDHVHIFVKTPPTASPHWVVQQLKGYTSHELRGKFPKLKSRLPTLWTRSYYCESVGHISEEAIKKYIEDQKGK